MAATSTPRRVWLMLTAAAVTLAVGIALGHGVLIAVGLVLAGTTGLGGRDDRPATWFSPSDVGAGTDGQRIRFRADSTVSTADRDMYIGMRRESPAMNVTHTTVPGTGRLAHLVTRGGQRLGVLTTDDTRQLLVYEPAVDPDVPVQVIELDADEADQVAAMLHSPSIVDRLDVLERTVAAVTKEHR
ncbi:hypothetical protein [Actinophytocola sediminis]